MSFEAVVPHVPLVAKFFDGAGASKIFGDDESATIGAVLARDKATDKLVEALFVSFGKDNCGGLRV